ncbi:potassium channel protein [Tahibacter amnicola]|uniref:Ion channel n=1 Tax=Tahibacter amnicola TaxID=2976241 RepID=A0ABY6BFE9_9GAMM|nr:ion channel [Tahibacter amnicola]UXI67331.1 ion channel [Tahibacter amnicola]
MPVFVRLMRLFRRHLALMSWSVLLLVVVAHCLISWQLMVMAGEEKLVTPTIWFYFYMVTAATIGYGDFSPQTDGGRLIATLWLLPGAITLFAMFLGKATTGLIDSWRRHAMGKSSYPTLKGHTVIVGWMGRDTLRTIDLLMQDTETDDEGILLAATEEIENPRPDEIRFVRLESLADPHGYQRAGIAEAARIIVNAATDEQTLAASFAVLANHPKGHIVATFDRADTCAVLRAHYPRVECILPLHVEVMVRAAQDAGSAFVAAELLSIAGGATQFSLRIPVDCVALSYGKLFTEFKHQHGATLLGYMLADGSAPRLNPPDTDSVAGGSMLYYIADKRVELGRVGWGACGP